MKDANSNNYDHPLRHIDDRVDKLLDAAIAVVLAKADECEGVGHGYGCDGFCSDQVTTAIERLTKVVMT